MKIDYIAGARKPRLNYRRVAAVATLACTLFGAALHLVMGDQASAYSAPTLRSADPEVTTALISVPVEQGGHARFEGIINQAVQKALTEKPADPWRRVKVGRGQNLTDVFAAAGLSKTELAAVLALGSDISPLKKLKAGAEINMRVVDQRLEELSFVIDPQRTLQIQRREKGLEAATLTAEIEHRQVEVAGVIRNSLFYDAAKVQVRPTMIMAYADLFAYDVDFAQDLQPGDRFSLVYDVHYAKGKKIRDGHILAAELFCKGKTYRVIRFVGNDGIADYFTPQGQSIRQGFIRSPLDFARIASPFNLRRLHPVLHTVRAHKGVDYAASIGTPIKATGAGVIAFSGIKGGYGNVVVIKHASGIETLYAHLSKFRKGLNVGDAVTMGQVIGYVGMSGLATGPHLHYEFRLNGIHQDPTKVNLPHADPVPAKQMASFRKVSGPMVAALDRSVTALAVVRPRNSKRK